MTLWKQNGVEDKQKLKGMLSKKALLVTSIVGGIVVVVAVVALVRGRQPTVQKVSIPPTQLLPYVSHDQARATICGGAGSQRIQDVCQTAYDRVGRNDREKIQALFSLLKQVEDDQSLSDYERYLLGQAVFASLPTKDSPLARRSHSPALLAELGSFFADRVQAQEVAVEGGFQSSQARDLQNILSGIPKGHNAWVVNVMVSKYSWANEQRQPLYSEQYGESVDPFPNNPNVNKHDIEYHVQSAVGSLSTDQEISAGSPGGSSAMTVYSFTVMSWASPGYEVAGTSPSEKHLKSRRTFSEEGYQGENLLSQLLASVKLPSREQPASQPAESAETDWGTPDKWETAYEAFFWMNLQDPSRFPSLGVLLAQDQEASGRFLRDLPLGTPVDLREYFRSAEVREHYEFTRQNTTPTTIPPLDEFLERIDSYQSNLTIQKPAEEQEQVPEKTPQGVSPGEAEYRRWLESIDSSQ